MGDIIRSHITSTNNNNTTPIHIMALDGIVTVNSLFSLAIFLGIVNADPTDSTYTLVSAKSPCLAGPAVAKDFVVFHVYSFSSFMFSTLIASALKQAIKASDVSRPSRDLTVVHVNTAVLRAGISACTVGSVFGCVFLMLALVNLVQIKLGVLDCHGFYSLVACIPLLVLVPLALLLYICIVLHAFTS